MFCNSLSLFAQSDYYYSAKNLDSTGTEKYWLYDEFGKLVFKQGFNWIHVNVWGWIFTFDNGKITAYDTSYTRLKIGNIEEIHNVWTTTKYIPIKTNGKWGYYNKSGKEVIKPKFDDITLFKNGKAAVKLKNKFFYINENGKKLKEKYTKSSDYEFGNLSFAYGLTSWQNYPQEKFKVGNRYGLRDVSSLQVLIPAIYEDLHNIQTNQVTAVLNGKFGVIDFRNNIIIPFEYKEIIVLD